MKSTGNELAFIRGLTLRKTLDVFGRLRTSLEDFGLLGESSEMIVPSSKIPAKKSQKKVGRYKMGRFYLSLHGVLEMLILIYRKYLHYFERPCSHGMCICDQQFSFGRIMFSPLNKIFPVRRWLSSWIRTTSPAFTDSVLIPELLWNSRREVR